MALNPKPQQLTWLLGGAALLRLVMIVFGEWQDRRFEVKYTDIDYVVFTDAAKFVWHGGSPYERYTYRYTPLLAYLLLPNVVLHGCWGKLLFSAAELLVGQQLFALLRLRGVQGRLATICTAVWLLNPFTFAVATRGNCEALVSAMLLRMILCLDQGHLVEGALWYGLAVHFRIYPIIFAPAIVLHLAARLAIARNRTNPKTLSASPEPPTGQTDPASTPADSNPSDLISSVTNLQSQVSSIDAATNASTSTGSVKSVNTRTDPSIRAHVASIDPGKNPATSGTATGSTARRAALLSPAVLSRLVSRDTVLFGCVSGLCFLALTGLFTALYPGQFLPEALLYHLTRTDPRHNFSIYFYRIYLSGEREASTAERLVAFLPQLLVQLFLAVRFAPEDLPLCIFYQTAAFVAFNKVITAQYFVWFFCLLPLALPTSTLRVRRWGAACTVGWVGAQLHWLSWAYLLEFEGKNVYLCVWVASLLFYAVTLGVLAILIRSNNFNPQTPHVGEKRDDKSKHE